MSVESIIALARPAAGVVRVPKALRRLAEKAARAPGGRPSDAVRRYLARAKPEEQRRRGELLALARQVMKGASGRVAFVPPKPRAVVERSFASEPRPPSAEFGWADANMLGNDPGFVGNEDYRPLQMQFSMEPFAGGGLFGLAAAVEGSVSLGSCEIQKPAVNTRNINRAALGMTYEAKPCDAWDWRPRLDTPRGLDILFGGPPCTPFSKASRLGRKAEDRGWEAHDNLFPLTLDWTCDLQPRVVIWENSDTLATDSSLRTWLRGWQEQMRQLGYETAVHLLAASDFGNPTLRKRTFIYAWPEGAPWGDELKTAPVGNYAKPGSAAVKRGAKMPWMPMVDRLTQGCCGGYGLADCVHLGGWAPSNDISSNCRYCVGGRNYVPAPNSQGEQGRKIMKNAMVTERSTGRKVPWFKWMKKAVGKATRKTPQLRYDKFTPADEAGAYVRIDVDARDLMAPARRMSEYLMRTVVPSMARRSDGLLIPAEAAHHPYAAKRQWTRAMLEQLQQMSVRDVAKLQDVPQWYVLAGTRNQAILQLGKGVPVNMGRAVIAHARAAMGLRVRAPWFDVRVRKERRPIRYQSRAQIQASTGGQSETWAALWTNTQAGPGGGMPTGLWPMDAMSICFGMPETVLGQGSYEAQVDDWDETSAMVGGQVERWMGRSRLDRGALVPASGDQRELAAGWADTSRKIFTPYGLDLRELWLSGWRGSPMEPPTSMPGTGQYDVQERAEVWGWWLTRASDWTPGPAQWMSLWWAFWNSKFPVETIWLQDAARWDPVVRDGPLPRGGVPRVVAGDEQFARSLAEIESK